MTETLSVILDLQKEFTAITEGDLSRVARHLGEIRKNERTLGTVHNVDARKLWAMAEAFEGRAARAAIEAKFTAESDDQMAEATRSHARAAQFERMIREIFWTQVKEDIGGEAWTSEGGIGLRAGWMMVACSKSPILNIIESIARGGDPE